MFIDGALIARKNSTDFYEDFTWHYLFLRVLRQSQVGGNLGRAGARGSGDEDRAPKFSAKGTWSAVREFFQFASRRSVVRRALKFAVVVGIVLISINHGDAILKGEVTRRRLFQMALTVMVPYIVSTLSSVQATREQMRTNGAQALDS